jgi:hypothetical protein
MIRVLHLHQPLPVPQQLTHITIFREPTLLCNQVLYQDFTCPVTAFYKGESQEKKLPGDWKEQRFLPGSPAHVMLGGSWGSLFLQSHVAVVTTPAVSDATSSTVAKIANHSSI